jgi:hypothetical protein
MLKLVEDMNLEDLQREMMASVMEVAKNGLDVKSNG